MLYRYPHTIYVHTRSYARIAAEQVATGISSRGSHDIKNNLSRPTTGQGPRRARRCQHLRPKCGARCVVNANVRDGRIIKISTQSGPWNPELPPLYACVRGFGAAEYVNHPDRLKYPVRRVGKRGSGEFERITWDEALDEVALQMLRIRDTYGPEAILDCSGTGSTTLLHNRTVVRRLLNKFGGCTELAGSMPNEAELFAIRRTTDSALRRAS